MNQFEACNELFEEFGSHESAEFGKQEMVERLIKILEALPKRSLFLQHVEKKIDYVKLCDITELVEYIRKKS